MTDIPEAAVEAAQRQLDWSGNMKDALEAAMPHIEAELRQQIAAEIREIPVGDFRTYDCLPSDYANMGRAEMREKVARIAERGGE